MLGKFECEYVGITAFVSKEGKNYQSVVLMQDMEVDKIFITDNQAKLFEGLNKMDNVLVEIDIKVSKDKVYKDIKSCQLLKTPSSAGHKIA